MGSLGLYADLGDHVVIALPMAITDVIASGRSPEAHTTIGGRHISLQSAVDNPRSEEAHKVAAPESAARIELQVIQPQTTRCSGYAVGAICTDLDNSGAVAAWLRSQTKDISVARQSR